MGVKLLAKPCSWCGWKYEGFHVCLKLPKEVMQRVEDGRVRDSNGKIVRKSKVKVEKDDSVVETPRTDPRRIERNKEILRLYAREGMTMREIAAKLELNDSTVMNVLHAAKDRGEITIRKAARRTGSR